MARTAKRYKKNTEKKVLGIPVCMAAIYARLILSILVYTLFSRMFDLMQPPAVKHSIAVV